ncbi:uncharacterized protein METZ01_LOCUS474593, partial [marine metagenome]
YTIYPMSESQRKWMESWGSRSSVQTSNPND